MIKYLDNGLGILALKGAQTGCINTNIFYAAGAADERKGASGVAHFLEHLSFKSTKDFKAGEFDSILKSLGASNNACTSSDYTHYYAYSAKEHCLKILELYSSMMDRLAFRQDEFDAEKLVILEEERLSVANNPFGKLWFRLHNEVYKNTSLEPSTIGYASEIKALSPEQVMSFYKDFYAPNNALIILSGDVSEELISKTAKIFENKKPAKNIIKRAPISATKERINITESFSDLGANKFILAYRIPSFNHPDFARLNALSRYYNLEHASPIINHLIKRTCLCCELECYAHASRHEGLFMFFGTCSEGVDANTAINELISQLKPIKHIDLLNKFLSLDELECLALPKQLASELGCAWAMGDINAGLNNLNYKANDDINSIMNKYFINEIKIILKEQV